MARAKKVTPVVEELEELDDAVELEELDDAVEPEEKGEGSGDMLTAKAAASKLGTDARTLRKFLRKKFGVIGQGQRWEVDNADIDALKIEFAAWTKGGADKAAKAEKAPKAKAPKAAPELDEEDALDAELEAFDEIEDLDFGDD